MVFLTRIAKKYCKSDIFLGKSAILDFLDISVFIASNFRSCAYILVESKRNTSGDFLTCPRFIVFITLLPHTLVI